MSLASALPLLLPGLRLDGSFQPVIDLQERRAAGAALCSSFRAGVLRVGRSGQRSERWSGQLAGLIRRSANELRAGSSLDRETRNRLITVLGDHCPAGPVTRCVAYYSPLTLGATDFENLHVRTGRLGDAQILYDNPDVAFSPQTSGPKTTPGSRAPTTTCGRPRWQAPSIHRRSSERHRDRSGTTALGVLSPSRLGRIKTYRPSTTRSTTVGPRRWIPVVGALGGNPPATPASTTPPTTRDRDPSRPPRVTHGNKSWGGERSRWAT